VTTTDASLAAIGLGWHPNGQATLSGPLLALSERLDRAFLRIASAWGADEFRFPTFIRAAELDRLDYFRSFPQLATFPVCLDMDAKNLEAFVSGEVVDGQGRIHLSRHAPPKDVLTPAACYPIYIHHQSSHFDRARYFTVRNTCFRQEEKYEPLVRQWSFSMREIVCVGTLEEVKRFLDRARQSVAQFLEALGVPIEWQAASDPFFQPAKNPKYLMQRLNPTKYEMVFGGRVAIGSVNLHQDHFGSTFQIHRAGGDAFSGCVAFGVERWLHAITAHFGADPVNWPDVEHCLPDDLAV
jgi:seryl-tRNA synthetase